MKKMLVILLTLSTILCGCNKSEVNKYQNTVAVSEEKTIQKTEQSGTSSVAADDETAEKPVVLYHGIPLNITDQKVDVVEGRDNTQSKSIYEKYEREYNLYSNNAFVEKSFGTIEGRGLDYRWQVAFKSISDKSYEVAISQSDNPYPRKIEYIKSNFPKEFSNNGKVITQINDKFKVTSEVKELNCVDVDGYGGNEYLVLIQDERNSFLAKCLVNSKYNIISYLTVFNEQCEDFKSIVGEYNLLDSSEIIDINNDA